MWQIIRLFDAVPLTSVKYEEVDHYYKAEGVEMADWNFLAKMCFVLNCMIEGFLEYESPVDSKAD